MNPAPYPTAGTQFEGQVPPEDPTHTSSVVSAQRVMQYLLARFNPIRGLTPQRLGTYLEQWDLGFLRWLALSWNQMRERDDTLKPVTTKREFAVSSLNWEILTTEESPEADLHKTALEFAFKNLTCTHALDQNQQGDVNMLMRQMMRAIGDKWAVHEIVWKPSINETGDVAMTAHFRFIPLWFFENRTGQLRYLPYELALDGIPLDAGGWLVTVGDGLNFASAIAYMYKQLGLKSWVNFVDKYGMPFVIGKTNAAYGSDEWNNMVAAVAGIRSDGSLVTNVQAQIEALKIDGAGSGQAMQEGFVDRMDRAMAKIWLGGDLSTHSRASSGVGALPQISQQDELAEADSILLSEAVNFYYCRWVLRYLYGTDKPKAYFKIVPTESIDTAKEIGVDQFLLGSGVSLGVDDLRERYNRPKPDAGDELATAPQAAGPDGEQIGKGVADQSDTGPLSLGNHGHNGHRLHAVT